MKLAAITSKIIFYEVGLSGSPVSIELGNWIDYGNILIEWNLFITIYSLSVLLPHAFSRVSPLRIARLSARILYFFIDGFRCLINRLAPRGGV